MPREPPSSRLPPSYRLIVIFKYLNMQYGVLQIFENPIWSSRTRIFLENQSYLHQWKNSVPSVLFAFGDTQDCQAVFFRKVFCAFGDSRPDVKFVKSKKFGKFHVRSRKGVFLCHETSLTSAIQANQTYTQRSYMHHKIRKIFI